MGCSQIEPFLLLFVSSPMAALVLFISAVRVRVKVIVTTIANLLINNGIGTITASTPAALNMTLFVPSHGDSCPHPLTGLVP